MGEYFKEGDRLFSDTPKKIEKMQSIKNIYSGFNCFFALTESKGLFGWGDNSHGQVSAAAPKNNISAPQSLHINMGSS